MDLTLDYYPTPQSVRFFLASFDKPIRLPEEAELVRTGTPNDTGGKKLLGLKWKHREYTLGISKQGILVAYAGKLDPTKPAALCIVLATTTHPVLFDARFTPVGEIAAKVRAIQNELKRQAAPKRPLVFAGNAYYPFPQQIAVSGQAPHAALPAFRVYS